MTLNAKRAAHFLVHSFAIIARLTLLNLISIICDRRFNLWGNRFIRLSNVPLLTVSSLNRLFITNHTIVSRVFALVWEQCLINLYLSGVLHGWMSRKSQNRGRHHVDKSTWNRTKNGRQGGVTSHLTVHVSAVLRRKDDFRRCEHSLWLSHRS